MTKEKNDKKEVWINWLFQTFKTIKLLAVRSATKFARVFPYE